MERAKIYDISSVAQITGASNRALRHYDRIGLVNPLPLKGGRKYSEDQLEFLKEIVFLRSLGYSLSDIAVINGLVLGNETDFSFRPSATRPELINRLGSQLEHLRLVLKKHANVVS